MGGDQREERGSKAAWVEIREGRESSARIEAGMGRDQREERDSGKIKGGMGTGESEEEIKTRSKAA